MKMGKAADNATNPTHPSDVWSESLSSQGTATDELEDADMLLGPVPTALRSGEDPLLGEEELWDWEDDDRRVAMVVHLRERERRGKASCPTTSPSAALTTPLVSKGTALELGEWGTHKKIRRSTHCRSTTGQIKKEEQHSFYGFSWDKP